MGKKPRRTWAEAELRWLEEKSHKKSICADIGSFEWLQPELQDYFLEDITRDKIKSLAKKKLETGVQPSTVNRMLELIRAVLKCALNDWEWIDKIPKVSMLKQDDERVVWLTKEKAAQLINELPEHLADMVRFDLATGLRETNVTRLKWTQIDLERNHAWIDSGHIKTKKSLAIPLNKDAMEVLNRQKGKHHVFVFTFRGRSVLRCNNSAWRKALKRCGIKNFRFHDLRHTWASWHVQNGTSLQELQQLGGWASYKMVLRYAHLSSDHLRSAAERITGA